MFHHANAAKKRKIPAAVEGNRWRLEGYRWRLEGIRRRLGPVENCPQQRSLIKERERKRESHQGPLWSCDNST